MQGELTLVTSVPRREEIPQLGALNQHVDCRGVGMEVYAAHLRSNVENCILGAFLSLWFGETTAANTKTRTCCNQSMLGLLLHSTDNRMLAF